MGLQPGAAPQGCHPHTHSPRRCYQALASAWFPFLLSYAHASSPCPWGYFSPMQRHLLFPLPSSSPLAARLYTVSESQEPLDFGLVFFLLALDALKSGGNSRLSEGWLAKTYRTPEHGCSEEVCYHLSSRLLCLKITRCVIWRFQSSLTSFPG